MDLQGSRTSRNDCKANQVDQIVQMEHGLDSPAQLCYSVFFVAIHHALDGDGRECRKKGELNLKLRERLLSPQICRHCLLWLSVLVGTNAYVGQFGTISSLSVCALWNMVLDSPILTLAARRLFITAPEEGRKGERGQRIDTEGMT